MFHVEQQNVVLKIKIYNEVLNVNNFLCGFCMDIKKRIGERIHQSRRKLGLSIKALSDKAGTLTAARIGNWENGTRSPGPTEAIILSKALNVAASYLLCLSDDERGEIAMPESCLARAVPVVLLSKAHHFIQAAKNQSDLSTLPEVIDNISLENKSKEIASKKVFAITLADNSMSPKFSMQDIVIVDPEKKPQPGDFVLAHIAGSGANIVRKYRESEQHSLKNKSFELIALNSDWGAVRVSNANEAEILATVLEHRAYL